LKFRQIKLTIQGWIFSKFQALLAARTISAVNAFNAADYENISALLIDSGAGGGGRALTLKV